MHPHGTRDALQERAEKQRGDPKAAAAGPISLWTRRPAWTYPDVPDAVCTGTPACARHVGGAQVKFAVAASGKEIARRTNTRCCLFRHLLADLDAFFAVVASSPSRSSSLSSPVALPRPTDRCPAPFCACFFLEASNRAGGAPCARSDGSFRFFWDSFVKYPLFMVGCRRRAAAEL